MKNYVTARQECPFCGYILDRAAGIWPEGPDRGPQPGDLTACVKCEAILEWNPAMRLQLFDETNVDPETKAQLAYLRLLLSSKNQ